MAEWAQEESDDDSVDDRDLLYIAISNLSQVKETLFEAVVLHGIKVNTKQEWMSEGMYADLNTNNEKWFDAVRLDT